MTTLSLGSLGASPDDLDTIAALETALQALGVTRVGLLYSYEQGCSADEGGWRCTLTTAEGDSRDGTGASLADALIRAVWAVCELRDQRARAKGEEAHVPADFERAMGRLFLSCKAGA